MTRKRLTVPEQNVREYAYELSYKLACEQLTGIVDVEKQCQKSGARYSPAEKTIVLKHLNKSYQIEFPGGAVSLCGSEEPVPIRDKILILHYFIRAKGTPLSGKTITYKELHDGINYYPTFFKRAISPIITNFGKEPKHILEVSQYFGGRRADYGDLAVTIDAFPLVPITIVLWRDDEEFPADGNLLFDSTIQDYLPIEDITILSEVIAWSLVKLLKTGGDKPG